MIYNYPARRLWKKICLDCGHCDEGRSEYLGFSFWFCSKCESRHLKCEIIVEEDKEE